MNIIKISVLAIFITTSFLYGHDFNYYQEKTLEVLPILGIDSTKVKFVEINSPISMEQRQRQKNVVFINTTALNTKLNTKRAIFECIVETKLSGLTKKEWEGICYVTPDFSPDTSSLWMYAALIPSSCIFAFKNKNNESWIRPLCLGTLGLSIIVAYRMWRKESRKHVRDRIAQGKREKEHNFQLQLFRTQLNTIEELLKHPETVSIAFAGRTMIQHHYPNILVGLDSIDTQLYTAWLNKVLSKLSNWQELYPDQYTLIQQELAAEKQNNGSNRNQI